MKTPFFSEELNHVDLDHIQFSDIFVLEEIQQLQDMFSNATGVASIITNPDGTPITSPSNFCKLCSEIIRVTNKGRLNCYRSDSELGRHNPSGPNVRTCFSGDLWDAGASITVGGKHIANWLIGQVRNDRSDVQRMMKYADEIGANKEDYYKALDEVPMMSFERFNSVAKMLFRFANEMSEKAYSNLLLKKEIAVREKMSELLSKSEEKYRLLVENCHDIIYTIDMEGVFTFVSPVLTSTLGYPVNSLIGKSFKDYIHPDDVPGFMTFISDLGKYANKEGCVYSIEYRARHQDLSWQWHTSGVLPIRDKLGNITGYYGAARDISNQKQVEAEIKIKNEALIKANAVKDKFLSIIAHDLKSPFCSIIGLSKVLAEDLSGFSMAQIQNVGKNINFTAENIYRLLENLLQWSKIQQNLITLDMDHVILLPVVQNSISLFKESLKIKKIEIVTHIPSNMQVYADVNILQTILRNLISNAIKFTHKGGKIEILTNKSEENFVEISVKDTGIGMSQEMLENLFRPDVQSGRSGTENEPSTGLGLLLCKEFIEKQGGEIYAESVRGNGSVFHFTVPLIVTQ